MKTSFKKSDIAHKFEAYNDILEQILGFRFVFETLRSNPKITSVLDYGCGPGKVSYRLAEKMGVNVYAVDESKEMINIASEKRSHPNIKYHLINNDHLSFLQDNSVDAAMACYVFINTEKKEQILTIMKEIYRVLTPQASFVILDTNPDSTGVEFSTFQNGRKGKTYRCGEARQEWLHLDQQEDLILHDFHWPKSVYEELLTEAGFQGIELIEPTLKDIPEAELKSIQEKHPFHHWKQEWEFPPFAIYKSMKPAE